MAFQKGDRKVIRAWTWFDWANSVYPLVITTAVFPLYYEAVIGTENAEGEKLVRFLGIDFINTELLAYCISISFLLVALVTPILSGIADFAGKKKRFMQLFSTLGALSSAGLFFFEGEDTLGLGIGLSILASVGFAGSLVFYNAFLPEIAHEKDLDRISATGFTMGYIGSSLLLIICLALIMGHEAIGIEEGLATRIAFLLAGIWWFGFAFLTWRYLPDNIYARKPEKANMLTKGWAELVLVWKILRTKNQGRLRLFLLAFFFYSMGYMTVIYLATPFAQKELGMGSVELITTVMLIQFIGIAGSYFFAWLAGKIGNIQSIMVAVLIWAVICGATWFVATPLQFYFLAAAVGTVMGGIQALSRSTYAKLLPETKDHASFYSFYDITEKVAITIGAYSFGLIENLTGSMRGSALFLGVFFFFGLLILIPVARRRPQGATA